MEKTGYTNTNDFKIGSQYLNQIKNMDMSTTLYPPTLIIQSVKDKTVNWFKKFLK